MQRLAQILLIALALASCKDEHPQIDAQEAISVATSQQAPVLGGDKVSALEGTPICIYTTSSQFEPFEVAEIVSENGGRTCFINNEMILMNPSSSCRSIDKFKLVDTVDQKEATSRFERCSALTRRSGEGGVKAIYYLLDEGASSSDVEKFSQFGLNAAKLVSNDGLSAYHFGVYGRLICFESPMPELVDTHLRGSGIDFPKMMKPFISTQSCAHLSQALQNLPWPQARLVP